MFLRPIEIMLVEDNPGDVRLTVEALKEARVTNELHITRDGVEAMSFLRREQPYGEAPRPDLIILDLSLPKKDGREVLTEIKGDPTLRQIPVVVMTTSDDDKDVLRAYDQHVNCYITKPVDYDQFVRIVRSVDDFWLSVVTLPRI